MIESMVNNFRYLIQEFGHIPNGNRTYFLSRSQPPFYSLMVKMLIDIKGKEIINDYLPSLVTEYNFWMSGTAKLTSDYQPQDRVIKVNESFLLNRYYDQKDSPREEMYGDDWHLIDFSKETHQPLYKHLRAACESGWDFSTRWFKIENDIKSIEAADIIPVDLNCLLWHLEKLISECYNHLKKDELSLNYGILATNRKRAIETIFWDEESGFYYDHSISRRSLTMRKTLAAVYPLFFGLATDAQAKIIAIEIEKTFLKDGGVVTTPIDSGQQWDSPNGWAPLQWMTIKGLSRYEFKTLAKEIALRWTTLNEKVYNRTGKMLEKYNVIDTNLEGGGGEYPVQDGFGWTNGVYLALTQ
jgi:alpha,alpha-trehalase